MDKISNNPLHLPQELNHPFFFTEQEIVVDIPIQSWNMNQVFIFEILFYNKMEAIKPWMKTSGYLPAITAGWKDLKAAIEGQHHLRNKAGISAEMRKGIGLFLQFLFWSNQKPVCLLNLGNLSDLKIKPVNIEERLNFILSRPGLFHSFVQLSELMTEQEKAFAKHERLKNDDE